MPTPRSRCARSGQRRRSSADPRRHSILSDHQPVTEVSVTELSRNVSAVISRVAGGERVIISRHGRPTAVIIAIDAGIDALIAGSEGFALLRREARERIEAGASAGAGSTAGQRLVFTEAAAAELAELKGQRRRMLERRLGELIGSRPAPGLVTVRSPVDLAACEVTATSAAAHAGGATVLVYAVRSLASMREALFGPQLARALWRRELSRLFHGRLSWARG